MECRKQLVELQKRYEDIRAAGAEVIAVSTDNLAGAEQSVSRFGVEFPILYTSRDSSIPASYGVFNLFGDGLASASIWLISGGNKIAWRSIGSSYTHQVHPNDIIEQVNLLNRGVQAGS